MDFDLGLGLALVFAPLEVPLRDAVSFALSAIILCRAVEKSDWALRRLGGLEVLNDVLVAGSECRSMIMERTEAMFVQFLRPLSRAGACLALTLREIWRNEVFGIVVRWFRGKGRSSSLSLSPSSLLVLVVTS